MVTTADIHAGDEVLALGLGPIGIMAIPLARRGAARIYAANRSGGRRMELARSWGANEVIELGDAPVSSIPFRRGVDRALVSAPPQAIPAVLPAMNYGGVVTFIGIDYGGRSAITLDANDFHFKKLQLRASHAAPALYFPAVLRLLADGAADGTLDGAAIVSHVLPLERIADAMCLARDNRAEVLKVVIKP
jgi:L-iditol 2-dehydrogenase